MKVETMDGGPIERRIVVSMITDKSALARIAGRWDRDMFASPWANLVGSWCVKFHEQHQDAPNRAIQSLYEAWAEKGKDKDTSELVSRFLLSISDEWDGEGANSDHIVDLAEKHFRKVRLSRLADNIKADLEAGDDVKAQARIDGYKPVEISASAGIDVLRDQQALINAFEKKSDPLITFNGRRLDPLNRFFRGALERDAFIGIMAAEKRGKSWLLMELAWRAILQRRKTAFFACGDMSQSQMELRWAVRAAQHPLTSKDGWPSIVKWPVELRTGGEQSEVIHEDLEYAGPVEWRQAWEGYQATIQKIKSDDTYLKLSCHPARSVSVKDIDAILHTWERAGWVPDCIIIDYADILGAVTRSLSPIDKVAEDWYLLRGMSQSRHCLVITATQVNAASYATRTLRRANFGGNHLKYAAVTGMMGINVDDEEKRMGLARWNWLQLRDGEFYESECVHVAGCLALANPMVLASF